MNYSEKWNPHNTFRSLWRTSCINSNPHRVPTSTKTYRKYKLYTSIRYLAGKSKHCFQNISITLVSYDIYIYVRESKKVFLQIHTCSNKQVPLHCTTNSPHCKEKETYKIVLCSVPKFTDQLKSTFSVREIH